MLSSTQNTSNTGDIPTPQPAAWASPSIGTAFTRVTPALSTYVSATPSTPSRDRTSASARPRRSWSSRHCPSTARCPLPRLSRLGPRVVHRQCSRRLLKAVPTGSTVEGRRRPDGEGEGGQEVGVADEVVGRTPPVLAVLTPGRPQDRAGHEHRHPRGTRPPAPLPQHQRGRDRP